MRDDRHLFSSLYDAAIRPQRWTPLLDELGELVGASGGAILSFDLRRDAEYRISYASSLYPDTERMEYAESYAHHEREHVAAALASAPGTIVVDPAFTENRDAVWNRPDVRFLRERYGVFDRFGVKLGDDDLRLDFLAFQYDVSRGNVIPAEAHALRPYLSHTAQALVLLRSFHTLKTRYQAVLSMLDHVETGVVLVDRRARVVLANACARRFLEAEDGLAKSERGHLIATDGSVRNALARRIEKASDTACGMGDDPVAGLLVSRPSGQDDYYVEVSPLKDTDNELDESFRGAMITIIDPNHRAAIDLRGVNQVYSLSKAETAVVTLLVDGLTHAAIAETRGVAPETVKSQVRSIMRKMRVRNRTQLVRRVLRLNLPIRT